MKWLLIIVGITVLVGVGTFGYYKISKKMMKPTMQQNSSLFTSIKDALAKSLTLQCTFLGDNGIPTTAYIKAGAIRVDTKGKTTDQMVSFITKDKKVYFWNLSTKQGTLMQLPDVSVTAQPGTTQAAGSPQQAQSVNMLGMLEKFKETCKPAVVADSLFTPPSDVTFTDLSKMMVPSKSTAQPTGMSQQDVQNMMQQYQKAYPTSSY